MPLGVIGIADLMARSLGFVIAGRLAAELLPPPVKKHLGWGMLPQAGVALGLALLAFARFPTLGKTIRPLVVGTTIIFEIIGPPFTRYHLQNPEEVHIGRRKNGPKKHHTGR